MKTLFLSLVLLFGSTAVANPFSNYSFAGECKKAAEKSAVIKLLGEPARSSYRILNSRDLGEGVISLGNLKLNLWTVEIADEADGAVMVVFLNPDTCKVHDTVFGTHALER